MSRFSDRSPPTRRQSWKQRGVSTGRGAPPAELKHVGRWLLTALLAALIGVFVWVLWPENWGLRHLVVVPVGSTDQLILPPAAFAREDILALRDVANVQVHDASPEALDASNLDAYVEKAAQLARRPQEVLFLYLAAHGIGDDGQAYVACSDFARVQGAGRYDMRQLLARVERSPAAFKLVVVDAGHLDYDPALGIVGNDFARSVVEAVAQLDSQELWVLLAAGGSQVSAVSYTDQRTVFGKAVSEALAGIPNEPAYGGNGDPYLDLREFYDYVSQSCRGWYGDALPDYQTPILARAGRGLFADIASLEGGPYRLLTIPPPKPPAGDESAKPDAPAKTDAPPPPANTAPAASGANPSAAGPPAGGSTPRTQAASTGRPSPSEWSAGLGPVWAPSGLMALQAAPPAASANPATAAAPASTQPATSAAPAAAGTPAAPAAASGVSPATTPPPAATGSSTPAAAPTASPTTAGETAPGTTAPTATAPGTNASPAAPATAPPAVSPGPDGKPNPRALYHQQLRNPLERLWTVRDRLRNRESATHLSPVDFAPHVWREAEAWMVYFERRLTASPFPADGSPPLDDRGSVLRDLEVLTENLERLLAAMNQGDTPRGRDEQSVGARLLDAWRNRYVPELLAVDDQFAREKPPELLEARDAVRQLHDLTYRAVDFVRWFGHSHTTLSGFVAFSQPIAGHLDDIGALMAELRSLEQSQLSVADQGRLRQFVLTQRSLASKQQELAAKIAALREDALAHRFDHLAQRRMDELLSTPMLAGPQRLALFDALRQLSSLAASPVPPSGATGLRPPPQVTIRWSSVAACLALELRLVRWIDPNTAASLERYVANATAASDLLQDSDTARAAEFWTNYRAAVAGLRVFYQGLRQPGPNEFALHLVDPRDATFVDPRQFPLPRFRIEVERPASLRIEPLASSVRLEPQGDVTVSATLVASRPNLLDTRVLATNADGLVQLELLPDSEESPAQGGLYRKTLHWRVAARRSGLPENKHTTSVRLAATLGQQEVEALIQVELPQPNRVDVVFTRAGIPETYSDRGDTTDLRLLANRDTRFVCSLINRHDRDKTVEVAVYAVAPQPRRFSQVRIGRFDAAIRRAVYDDAARVFQEGTLVAKSAKPIELKGVDPNRPGEVLVPVDFVRPSAAAPPPADPAGAAKPPTAAPAPPPEPIHGLVIKITDVQDRQREWLQWIELTPLSPREYLDAEIGYNQAQQQIIARFTPKIRDAQGRPLLPGGEPLEINWDASGADLPPQGKQLLSGKLDAASPSPVTVLSAQAPPDGQAREVKIAVDGFPRAFLYSVTCARNPAAPPIIPGKDLARERTAIRIESVRVANQLKIYHFPPHVRRPPPLPDAKGPQEEHIDLQRRQPALFAGPADLLLVQLQADAPLDAFTNESDRIQVKLEINNLTRDLRATRDFTPAFVNCGPSGLLELHSQLSDIVVPLDIGSLLNAEASVITNIRFSDQTRSDRVDVRLDGDTPIIQAMDLPRDVNKDSPLPITFRVADFSGVTKVVYALSRDGSVRLDDASATTRAVEPTRDEARRFVFTATLDTKDLAVGSHLLVAKVVDPVGRESELISRPFRIVQPVVIPPKFEVRGRVRSGRAAVSGNLVDLTIEGAELPTRPVPLQGDGSFVVSDLKPGEYTLKAKGFVGNRERSKEVKVKATDVKLRISQDVDLAG